ncbi:phage tail tape measure protein [Escherichia coli]|nr:phage tail tape measure protein [Escherichia coli]EFO5587123.1 phage tail tape measure protein [Escherichia coli]
MTVKYYAILTNQGAARLANATMLGSKLNLTQMAVGDANGVLPTPDPAQTKLINQKRIAPLNLLSVDPNNQSQIIAEQIIPENEGGFWIREIGLYDDEGVLIAVANCPETYKPQLQEGSGRTQTIRMILVVTNTEAITLKIDPSVVLATRKYVDDEVLELRLYVDEQMRNHIAAQDPHTQYAQKHNPTFTGEPKAPTPDAGNNTTRIATTAFVQAAIEGFRNTSAQLAVTGHALEKARQEAEALATQFKNTERPTRAQAKVLESAKRAAEDLQAKYNRLTDSVKRQQRELAAVGINTRNLAHDEQGLKNRISETTAQLNRQRDALARVSAQQAKLNAVKQRYQAGKELAGNMASVGAAGVGIAAAGTMAGVKLLIPGYEFAQKNSELQAVLGVAKDSAEMAALRKQARQLGDNTAASADDAAGAQIIIAKAGGDVDAIQAATPVTLNMALANRRTMEENAALLMGMKSAFQLSNDKVAHIGDVLSMTMNKTAADFDGMSDALTYAAPVAKNAGVSIEETAAMVGALHDAKITGSMAGTGSRAVLSRLQAPTGKAWDALKELGVKTSDSKGNTRPIFTILKEMQASFEKNRLGTAQQAEYMKTIFGEEASSAAAVLMTAASTGKLDKLTAAFIGKQAESLIGKAGSMATKFTGMTGAG